MLSREGTLVMDSGTLDTLDQPHMSIGCGANLQRERHQRPGFFSSPPMCPRHGDSRSDRLQMHPPASILNRACGGGPLVHHPWEETPCGVILNQPPTLPLGGGVSLLDGGSCASRGKVQSFEWDVGPGHGRWPKSRQRDDVDIFDRHKQHRLGGGDTTSHASSTPPGGSPRCA
jgi:hypothetical protein